MKNFTTCLLLLFCLSTIADTKTITFSNLTWIVKDGVSNPGHNNWSGDNVWVDSDGFLHLKITHVKDKWYCPGIYSEKAFGFGQYWFYTFGRLDSLDPNVVVALFSYPTPNVGPDETNEIDIEFSKWGDPSETALNMSFTVWPTIKALGRTLFSYRLKQMGDYATYGYTWNGDHIFFQSGDGQHADYTYPIISWLFNPPDYTKHIAQQPLPIHLYMYLLPGQKPSNNKEIEIVIKQFCFKSSDDKQLDNC